VLRDRCRFWDIAGPEHRPTDWMLDRPGMAAELEMELVDLGLVRSLHTPEGESLGSDCREIKRRAEARMAS